MFGVFFSVIYFLTAEVPGVLKMQQITRRIDKKKEQ